MDTQTEQAIRDVAANIAEHTGLTTDEVVDSWTTLADAISMPSADATEVWTPDPFAPVSEEMKAWFAANGVIPEATGREGLSVHREPDGTLVVQGYEYVFDAQGARQFHRCGAGGGCEDLHADKRRFVRVAATEPPEHFV